MNENPLCEFVINSRGIDSQEETRIKKFQKEKTEREYSADRYVIETWCALFTVPWVSISISQEVIVVCTT